MLLVKEFSFERYDPVSFVRKVAGEVSTYKSCGSADGYFHILFLIVQREEIEKDGYLCHKIPVMRELGDIYKEANYKGLFESFYKPLVSFATVHTSNPDVAEDLVQEVFVYIWSKELDFENLLALKTYLYRSVLNRCRNHLRDMRMRQEHEQIILHESDELDNSLMNGIIREEVYRQLTAALDHLPPQCRKIYEMAQDGMKSSEIAEELGLAVETVKRQRKIARRILQERLGKYTILLVLMKFF